MSDNNKITSERQFLFAIEAYLERKYDQAIELATLSAEQGNAFAQLFLGLCYEKGNIVDQDYEKALRLAELSTEQGNVLAFFYATRLHLNSRQPLAPVYTGQNQNAKPDLKETLELLHHFLANNTSKTLSCEFNATSNKNDRALLKDIESAEYLIKNIRDRKYGTIDNSAPADARSVSKPKFTFEVHNFKAWL